MPDVITRIAPDIRRVLAPNPSPMTYTGTNSYIVGTGSVAVIDPGPDDPIHLAALLSALDPGETISHIIVTHTHLDHSGLARRLSNETKAPVLGFGTFTEGRSAIMQQLADKGLVGGGEGIDRTFEPDIRVSNEDVISGDTWKLDVLHTPGHAANHICLALGETLFTGDHVMGWASSMVSPPDGDLAAFMQSCRRLQRRSDQRYLPGHGAPVESPSERLNWLIEHRQAREQQILAALTESPSDVPELTLRVYHDAPADLIKAAERNVLAHLIHLEDQGLVDHEGMLTRDSLFFNL